MIFSESLKKNRDFQQVYRQGTSAAERYFVMYALKNGTEQNRIGVSASKKVGNSVVRHRIKRLVLEGYRKQEGSFSRGYDLVIIARIAAADCTQKAADAGLRTLGKKLHIWENDA